MQTHGLTCNKPCFGAAPPAFDSPDQCCALPSLPWPVSNSGSNGVGPKKAPKKKEAAAKEPEEFKGFGSKK